MTATIPLGAAESLAFVTRNLPDGDGLRILDIGAGRGEIAASLAAAGHHLTVVEPAPAGLDACRGLGLAVVSENWPCDLSVGAFDCVLFIRSLHHIGALAPALNAAAQVLRSGATLIIDDFDFKKTPEETKNWFYRYLRRLAKDGASFQPGSFPCDLLQHDNAEPVWRKSHDHIHAYSLMREAVADNFQISWEGHCPYFYRYVDQWQEPDDRATDRARRCLQQEIAAIDSGRIAAIGRRLVAVKP